MMPQEKEIKIDLEDESSYLKLLEFLGNPRSRKRQINYFFDTDDFSLEDNGWALRIRDREGDGTITLKGLETRDRQGLTIRPEIEESFPTYLIPEAIKQGLHIDRIPANLKEITLAFIDSLRLNLRVSFETERTTVLHKINDQDIDFEIDRTVYPDGSVDFELEIELEDKSETPAAIKYTREVFERLGIEWKLQSASKFARALKKSGPVK